MYCFILSLVETILGFRIKKLREKANLNQAELAKYLGNSQRTISSWEKSVVEPSVDMLKKIARLFKVSIDYLTGNDFMTFSNIHEAKRQVLEHGNYDYEIKRPLVFASDNPSDIEIVGSFTIDELDEEERQEIEKSEDIINKIQAQEIAPGVLKKIYDIEYNKDF